MPFSGPFLPFFMLLLSLSRYISALLISFMPHNKPVFHRYRASVTPLQTVCNNVKDFNFRKHAKLLIFSRLWREGLARRKSNLSNLYKSNKSILKDLKRFDLCSNFADFYITSLFGSLQIALTSRILHSFVKKHSTYNKNRCKIV